jgi:hypothetical protein
MRSEKIADRRATPGTSRAQSCRRAASEAGSGLVDYGRLVAGYWKYGFTPCGSGVLSSATIIDEI